MSLKRDDVEEALERKGFKKNQGDHRFFIFYSKDGKKTPVGTKTSHGSGYKVLGDPLVAKMARQCKLTKGEFTRLVECTLSHEQYEEKLNQGGQI